MELQIPANRYDYPSGFKVVGQPYPCDECDGSGFADGEDLGCPICQGCGELKTIVRPDLASDPEV